MQIKNNYDIFWERDGKTNEAGSGVFNGEFGTIIDINEMDKEIVIKFDDDKKAWYSYADLDQIDIINSSDVATTIMPIAQAAPMLLTRNLLYTAMTRAKKMLIIIGNKNVIDFMINNTDSKKRNTGLEYKLRKL